MEVRMEEVGGWEAAPAEKLMAAHSAVRAAKGRLEEGVGELLAGESAAVKVTLAVGCVVAAAGVPGGLEGDEAEWPVEVELGTAEPVVVLAEAVDSAVAGTAAAVVVDSAVAEEVVAAVVELAVAEEVVAGAAVWMAAVAGVPGGLEGDEADGSVEVGLDQVEVGMAQGAVVVPALARPSLTCQRSLALPMAALMAMAAMEAAVRAAVAM